jgi:cytidylate kinase
VRWKEDDSMGIWCAGEEISRAIRTEAIGMVASRISARRVVRECLWKVQRELGDRGRFVFEGRDMGSWVFPDAGHRFFITASLGERARRRHRELQQRQEEVSLEAVREKMAQRDAQDSSRELAPLTVPRGAWVIDTTDLSPEQVMRRMMEVIRVDGREGAAAGGERGEG